MLVLTHLCLLDLEFNYLHVSAQALFQLWKACFEQDFPGPVVRVSHTGNLFDVSGITSQHSSPRPSSEGLASNICVCDLLHTYSLESALECNLTSPPDYWRNIGWNSLESEKSVGELDERTSVLQVFG